MQVLRAETLADILTDLEYGVDAAHDGPGLDPDQRRRIFDPFFTTKAKGTGLGMAIARRVVEAHGGRISIGDDGRPGAEFLIILPRGTS